MRREIRISSISDIHLGHRRNTAEQIIENLNTHFSNEKHFSQIDLVVFAGDVFDEALALSSEFVAHIDGWVAHVLRLCRKYGVKIRVLEGTPSHDRGQSERFTIINDIYRKYDLGVDLQYAKTLSVEYIEEFDINILYVPDEWNHHSTDKTLEEVRELLRSKGLAQVDFAVMHGNFHYQLPAHIKSAPRHSEDAYLSLVKYLIFIGHIHIHTRYERIVAQGSFDRLAHGEEAPKGFVHAIVQPSGDYTLKFVVNKTARKYVTLLCAQEDMEESLRYLDHKVAKLPTGACVRVEAHYLHPILGSLDVVRQRWPLLVWSPPLVTGKESESAQALVNSDEYLYVPISVRPDNLVELMSARLARLGLNPNVLARCATELETLQRI